MNVCESRDLLGCRVEDAGTGPSWAVGHATACNTCLLGVVLYSQPHHTLHLFFGALPEVAGQRAAAIGGLVRRSGGSAASPLHLHCHRPWPAQLHSGCRSTPADLFSVPTAARAQVLVVKTPAGPCTQLIEGVHRLARWRSKRTATRYGRGKWERVQGHWAAPPLLARALNSTTNSRARTMVPPRQSPAAATAAVAGRPAALNFSLSGSLPTCPSQVLQDRHQPQRHAGCD